MSHNLEQELQGSIQARVALLRKHLADRFAMHGRVWSNDTTAQDRVFHSIDYVSRAAAPRSTSWYELKDARRILKEYLATHPLPKDALIADIGAGDGRITALLREMGYMNIIALDIDHDNVARLSERFECEGVCASAVETDTFPEKVFDLVVAWGLFTCLPSFSDAIETVRKWIVPGGALIAADPTLESVLLYTLVRGDIGEFLRTASTKTRAAMWDERENRYTVYTAADIRKWLYGNSGLQVIAERNVNVFPSLIAGGFVQDQKLSAKESAQLLDSINFDAIDGVPRQISFLARRKA